MQTKSFNKTVQTTTQKTIWPGFTNLKTKLKLGGANLKRGLWSFTITLTGLALFSEHVHFIKSYTDSLPHHYFVQLPKIKPQKGDLTIVYNGFYKGRIIKRIIGTAGDQISADAQGNIFINQEKVGKARERTEFCAAQTDGKDTITLTAIKSQVIPEGRVFLHSPHPKSFDSRYNEVGLVPVSDLEGLIIGIV